MTDTDESDFDRFWVRLKGAMPAVLNAVETARAGERDR